MLRTFDFSGQSYPINSVPGPTVTLGTEVFRLDDAAQASNPVFFELSYLLNYFQTSSAHLSFGLRIGNGYDGAALTGSVSGAAIRTVGMQVNNTYQSGSLTLAADRSGFLLSMFADTSRYLCLGLIRLTDPVSAAQTGEVLSILKAPNSSEGGYGVCVNDAQLGLESRSATITHLTTGVSLVADGSAYLSPGPLFQVAGRSYGLSHSSSFLQVLAPDLAVEGGLYPVTFPDGTVRRFLTPPGFATNQYSNLSGGSTFLTALAVE